MTTMTFSCRPTSPMARLSARWGGVKDKATHREAPIQARLLEREFPAKGCGRRRPIVGWVERSETHHLAVRAWWVSLRSTVLLRQIDDIMIHLTARRIYDVWGKH